MRAGTSRKSLAIATRLQDEGAQAAALNNLSLLLKEKEQIQQAIVYAQKSLTFAPTWVIDTVRLPSTITWLTCTTW
jgi:hypothetical protein